MGGSDKSKINYKIIGPVIQGRPPPIVLQPANLTQNKVVLPPAHPDAQSSLMRPPISQPPMMMLNPSMMTPATANTWMPPSSVPLRSPSQPSVPVRTLVPSQPPAPIRNQPNPNVYRNKMNTNIMSKSGESKGTTVRLQLGTDDKLIPKSQAISNGDHDYGGNRTTSLLASRLQSDPMRINQMNGGQGTVNYDHSYGFGGKNTSGVGGDHNYGDGRTQHREES